MTPAPALSVAARGDILPFMQRRAFLLQAAALGLAEAVEIDVLRQPWTARWIHPPAGENLQDYGVYHFRRTVELPAQPAKCTIHVTADSRY